MNKDEIFFFSRFVCPLLWVFNSDKNLFIILHSGKTDFCVVEWILHFILITTLRKQTSTLSSWFYVFYWCGNINVISVFIATRLISCLAICSFCRAPIVNDNKNLNENSLIFLVCHFKCLDNWIFFLYFCITNTCLIWNFLYRFGFFSSTDEGNESFGTWICEFCLNGCFERWSRTC